MKLTFFAIDCALVAIVVLPLISVIMNSLASDVIVQLVKSTSSHFLLALQYRVMNPSELKLGCNDVQYA